MATPQSGLDDGLVETGHPNHPHPATPAVRTLCMPLKVPLLYFRNRAELLIATTQYLDELKNSDERLRPSRTAGSGKERLDAYITAWCDYVPEIYGASRALLAMNDADSQRAWSSRMQDMWEGCEAAIRALKRDGQLTRDYSVKEASDLLWTLLSVRNWENLRIERSWSQEQYLAAMMKMAHRLFVDE